MRMDAGTPNMEARGRHGNVSGRICKNFSEDLVLIFRIEVSANDETEQNRLDLVHHFVSSSP